MGISQENLADMLGVSTQAVSIWERNENLPETKKLLAVAKALHLSLDYLVSEEDENWATKLLYPDKVLEKAIAYAAVKHSGTMRKGTTTPYIVHPMEVAAIASCLTDDEEVLSAAVLHDVLEDTHTTKQELVQIFGQRIADLVADESENKREERPAEETWRERKAETIRHLAQTSHEARIIALADKLANMRAIERDYEALGDQLWQRFNTKDKADHAWYYANVFHALYGDPGLRESPLLTELMIRIRDVFNDVLEAGNARADENKLDLCCVYRGTPVPDGAVIWSLIFDYPDDDDQKQLQLMAMIYDRFLRSENVGFADTHLIVTNDPDADDVTWEKTADGYAIHLCATSTMNWCQVGYQLGYAMLHCLIDHLNPDEPTIAWAEELICEAGTLALLKLLAEKWKRTPLAEIDPDYAASISEYIDENLTDQGTAALIRCPDRDALRKLNEANCFDDRINESHDLFSKTSKDDLLRLVQIRAYAADELLLFTHHWRDCAEGSQAVEYICRLQEHIPGCELPAGVSTEIDLENSQPTAQQLVNYEQMIRNLRYLPGEHLIFDFLDADKEDCEQIGLVFYQVCRAKDHSIHAEIRMDTKDGRRLYRTFCEEDGAVAILDDLVLKNDIPDLDYWEDFTECVWGNKGEKVSGISSVFSEGAQVPEIE